MSVDVQDYIRRYIYNKDTHIYDEASPTNLMSKYIVYLVKLQLYHDNIICVKDKKTYVTRNNFDRPIGTWKKHQLTTILIAVLKNLIDMYSTDNVRMVLDIIIYITNDIDVYAFSQERTLNEIVTYILTNKRLSYIIEQLASGGTYKTSYPFKASYIEEQKLNIPTHIHSQFDMFSYECEIFSRKLNVKHEQTMIHKYFSYKYLFKLGYYKTIYKFIRKPQVRTHIIYNYLYRPGKYLFTRTAIIGGCITISLIIPLVTVMLFFNKKTAATVAANFLNDRNKLLKNITTFGVVFFGISDTAALFLN